jgi:hypothetical protein
MTPNEVIKFTTICNKEVINVNPENQIFENASSRANGGLQVIPVTSVKFTALNPVQFDIAPVNSVKHAAVGPNDIRCHATRAANPGRSNGRIQSQIRLEEKSALRMNGYISHLV